MGKKILKRKYTPPFSVSKILLLIALIFFTTFYEKEFSDFGEIFSNPSDESVKGTSDDNRVIISEVIDGDTVRLSDGRVLRYIGIDTPEDPKATNEECYALESFLKNQELVLGKEVHLEKDVSEVDRYGRLLRYVWLNDVMINEVLVKEGYAKAVTYRPDIKYQKILQDAENKAKEVQKGLWSSCL